MILDSIPLLLLSIQNLSKMNARPCPMFVGARKIDNTVHGNPNRFSQLWRSKIDAPIQLNRFAHAIKFC